MASPPPKSSAKIAPTGISLANRLSLYSPKEWEEFVAEWMEGFDPKYHTSQRLGGAGDKGRDVVGYTAAPGTNPDWDNYQCKHYAKPLPPSKIWVELGKMCYHSCQGDFKPPRKYLFVAPNEVSPGLQELLKAPEKLRSGLLMNWNTHCAKAITDKVEIKLEGPLLDYVKAYDFSGYGYVTLQTLLVQHSRTPFWVQRFQVALPARPAPAAPPDAVDQSEARYVEQLFEAYSDETGQTINNLDALKAYQDHHAHFQRSRKSFYSAESLHRFTRDQLKPGAFEHFKKQIYDGVIDTAQAAHANALARVKATTSFAGTLQLAQNEIARVAEIADKQGACHHLANEDKLKWKL